MRMPSLMSSNSHCSHFHKARALMRLRLFDKPTHFVHLLPHFWQSQSSLSAAWFTDIILING